MAVYSISLRGIRYIRQQAISAGYVRESSVRARGVSNFISDLGEQVGIHGVISDTFYDNRPEHESSLDENLIASFKTPIWNIGHHRRGRNLSLTNLAEIGFIRVAYELKIVMPDGYRGSPKSTQTSAIIAAVLEAIGVQCLGVKKWPEYTIGTHNRYKLSKQEVGHRYIKGLEGYTHG